LGSSKTIAVLIATLEAKMKLPLGPEQLADNKFLVECRYLALIVCRPPAGASYR
jgi:hypothetical protein